MFDIKQNIETYQYYVKLSSIINNTICILIKTHTLKKKFFYCTKYSLFKIWKKPKHNQHECSY